MRDKEILEYSEDKKNKTLNIENYQLSYLQIKYKQSFESFLLSLVDFKKIDIYLQNNKLTIPVVQDSDYNLYRKFSTLESQYVYIRNNIHIERLDEEEIRVINNSISNNTILSTEFITKTFPKVLYEDGEFVFHGIAIPERMANSKSIVFEFAYDQLKCDTPFQIRRINEIFSIASEQLKNILTGKHNISISTLVYNTIPDIYKIEEKTFK